MAAIILPYSSLVQWAYDRVHACHGNTINPHVLKAHQGVAITYSALAVKNSATTMSAVDRNDQATHTYMNCAAEGYIKWLDAQGIPKPYGLHVETMRHTTLGSGKERQTRTFTDTASAVWSRWETIKKEVTRDLVAAIGSEVKVNDKLPSGQQLPDLMERLMVHVWAVAQKKKMEDRKKRQSQKTVMKKCDSTDNSSKGGGDANRSGTTDGGACAMPKNWAPPHLLVYALWGPQSAVPEQEFNLLASSGPDKKKRRVATSTEADTPAEGDSADDPLVSAVESPEAMKKLNDDGGMMSRRSLLKAKKEKSAEETKRVANRAAQREKTISAMQGGVEQASQLRVQVARVAAVKERQQKVRMLRDSISVLKELGRSAEATEKMEELLLLLTSASAENSSLASTETDGIPAKSTLEPLGPPTETEGIAAKSALESPGPPTETEEIAAKSTLESPGPPAATDRTDTLSTSDASELLIDGDGSGESQCPRGCSSSRRVGVEGGGEGQGHAQEWAATDVRHQRDNADLINVA